MSESQQDPALDGVGDDLFFNKDGQSIPLAEYLRLHRDLAYRILARDQVGDLKVVTAWLGADQGPFADEERPLIFGTVALIAGAKGELFEDRETWAATSSEALTNHQVLVDRLRALERH